MLIHNSKPPSKQKNRKELQQFYNEQKIEQKSLTCIEKSNKCEKHAKRRGFKKRIERSLKKCKENYNTCYKNIRGEPAHPTPPLYEKLNKPIVRPFHGYYNTLSPRKQNNAPFVYTEMKPLYNNAINRTAFDKTNKKSLKKKSLKKKKRKTTPQKTIASGLLSNKTISPFVSPNLNSNPKLKTQSFRKISKSRSRSRSISKTPKRERWENQTRVTRSKMIPNFNRILPLNPDERARCDFYQMHGR